jgi:hypothetical protein
MVEVEVEIQSFLTTDLVRSDRFTRKNNRVAYCIGGWVGLGNCLDVLENSQNPLLLSVFELASSRTAMGKAMCCTITVQHTCVYHQEEH